MKTKIDDELMTKYIKYINEQEDEIRYNDYLERKKIDV